MLRNDADHQQALARAEMLFDAAAGTPASDELDVLVMLIELYEREHQAVHAPDPVSAIRFRMEQGGHTKQELERLLGSRSRVSEVLSGRRALSLAMIKSLHREWAIPLESLLTGPLSRP